MLIANFRPKRAVLILGVSMFLSACSTMDGYRESNPQPDDRLDHILALYEVNREDGKGCNEMWHPGNETIDCGRLLNELDRLMAEFPHHERILMANAVFSYKSERKDRAQQVLDQLLNHSGSHPEAAILRAKIALEEGNNTLAGQVLRRQIMLVPDNSDLRSALAAVHYANGEYQKARNVLEVKGLSNNYPWEVSYHFGLLAEGDKDWFGACQYYQASLQQQPGYAPAMARLIGLSEYIQCSASGASSYESSAPASTYAVDNPPALTVASALVLNDISVSNGNANSAFVTFNTEGFNPEVRALQVAEPPQVIVDLPGASNTLSWQQTNFDNNYVKAVSLENLTDRVRVRVSLRSKVNVQLVNEPGNLRVVLVGDQ